jgi:hypothetical protein
MAVAIATSISSNSFGGGPWLPASTFMISFLTATAASKAGQLVAHAQQRPLGWRLSPGLFTNLALGTALSSGSASWIDWAVELFVWTESPPTQAFFMGLEAVGGPLQKADLALLADYIDSTKARDEDLSEAELVRLLDLCDLVGNAAAGRPGSLWVPN